MPYPKPKYSYNIAIDGCVQAVFSEVSAADLAAEPIECREHSRPDRAIPKMPGLQKYSSIALKMGSSCDKVFTDWVVGTNSERIERKTVIIQLVDDTSTNVIAAWEVVHAWPSKYTTPGLSPSSDTSVMAFESIEIAHEGLKRTT